MTASLHPSRLLPALASTLLLAGPAAAASVVYQLSGTMTATNALGLTLRDQAGFERTGNNIPFQARIEFDAAALAFVVSSTPGLQSNTYDRPVTQITLSLGGFDYQTVRGFYSAPRGSFEANWNEARTDVTNSVSIAGIDQFVTETTDRSATPLFPGPKQAMFNAYSLPVSLVTGGVVYNTLSFRAADTRLFFSGFNLLDGPGIPAAIRVNDSMLAGFTLGMWTEFSGPGGAVFTGKANFMAQPFSFTVSTIPEPTTGLMVLAGLAVLAGVARRRLRGPDTEAP